MHPGEFPKRQTARNFCRNRRFLESDLTIIHPDGTEEPYQCRIAKINIAALLLLLFVGCTHQRAVISPQARTVIRADVRTMPEDQAVEIWLSTGVYRGLTDEEWINLMVMLRVVNDRRLD